MATTATYTVFDGAPAESGACNWPGRTDVPYDGDQDAVLAVIAKEARQCGEYADGDRIWVTFWEDGEEVVTRSVVL